MYGENILRERFIVVGSIFLVFLLSGCTNPSTVCPALPPANDPEILAYADDDQLDLRFPLDEVDDDVRPYPAIFGACCGGGSSKKYHAAEDYPLPPGTPVYAIADGIMSYSAPMGGYGWLIIIDHPQANIYSLYGHLSPSRWRLESGLVEKGDLIGYLGDPDENGGSPENPLRPHLHFAIRTGQRTDYPGMGEWRWQAGWIKPCPQDLGWLQPTGVIINQEPPPGGYPEQRAGIFEKWGVEITFISVYVFVGVFVMVRAAKKQKPIMPVAYGGLMIVSLWVMSNKGTRIGYALFAVAVISIGFAIYLFLRQSHVSQKADGNG